MIKISTAGPQAAPERLRAIMTDVSKRRCEPFDAIQAVQHDPTLLMELFGITEAQIKWRTLQACSAISTRERDHMPSCLGRARTYQ